MGPSNSESEAEFIVNILDGVFIVSTCFLTACITPMSLLAGVEVLKVVAPFKSCEREFVLRILPNNLPSQASTSGPLGFGNPQLYVPGPDDINCKGFGFFS